MSKSWIRILVITFIAALIPVVFVIFVYAGVFGILQSENDLLRYRNATASLVVSQEGELIGRIFIENRTTITYSQLPTHLINALVSAEDVRFYKHRGIDSRSLFRVFFKTILFNKQRSGGGSTITQQLAKNMFGRKRSGPFAIIINKTKEGFLAHRLEKVFTKEEILTLYLNTVSFGENVFGIGTASQRYFNKKAENLNIEESAVLVGMLKANNSYNPRLYPENARKRRNLVLSQMQKYKYLKTSESDSLSALPLILNYSNLETGGPADYFLYQVKNEVKQILQDINLTNEKKWNAEEDGLLITTTLNIQLQKDVNNTFHDHLAIMQKRLNEQYESRYGRKLIEKLAESELMNLKLDGRSDEVDFGRFLTGMDLFQIQFQ
ncbi:MAG: penicillin-binding protein [Bacteroidales bacterium]|nr:penicillin-binding protein [Bacteroidales bacterium]